jgi:glycosyltransferase involved in cell wall biosynthesis
MHSELAFPQSKPFCLTIHGNTNQAREFHENTIFCSQKHAQNHGAQAFVHLGLDPREYGSPNFHVNTNSRFIFLGKAAWKLKNVKGAISVAKKSGAEIDVLGGTRLNFKMGFRLTLDRAAHFHGMVGGAEKYNLMRNAKGLIFPVLWDEPGATAVIESLYFGLPVFATPYGCLVEQVRFYSESTINSLWDSVDILLTANPNLLLNHPENKKLIKYEAFYNKDIKNEYSISTLKELKTKIEELND